MSSSAKVKIIFDTIVVEVELSSDQADQYPTTMMEKVSKEAQAILKKLACDGAKNEKDDTIA